MESIIATEPEGSIQGVVGDFTDTTNPPQPGCSSDNAWLIPKEELYGYIPYIIPYIKQVLIKSKAIRLYGVEDVIAMLCLDKANLWLIHDGFNIKGIIIVQILKAPKANTLFLWLTAGKGIIKEKHLSAIEKWAKETHNCIFTETIARFGLAKVLKEDMGFKHKQICCIRELL